MLLSIGEWALATERCVPHWSFSFHELCPHIEPRTYTACCPSSRSSSLNTATSLRTTRRHVGPPWLCMHVNAAPSSFCSTVPPCCLAATDSPLLSLLVTMLSQQLRCRHRNALFCRRGLLWSAMRLNRTTTHRICRRGLQTTVWRLSTTPATLWHLSTNQRAP